MASLSQNLMDAVKKLAFKTSIDQLQKKGVKQVNVLGIDRLVALIDEAVHRSLKHKLLGLERDQVADATKAEFLRMLQTNEDLAKQKDEVEKLKERAEEEVQLLRDELGRQKRNLQERLNFSEVDVKRRYAGENAAIAQQIDALFRAQIDRSTPNLAELRDQLLEHTLALLDTERKAVMIAQEAARDREIDVLQRRIGKLNEALADSEQQLAHAATAIRQDPGLPSVFKQVQGLSADDVQAAKKKELMAVIFKANLALQKGSMGE